MDLNVPDCRTSVNFLKKSKNTNIKIIVIVQEFGEAKRMKNLIPEIDGFLLNSMDHSEILALLQNTLQELKKDFSPMTGKH